MQLIKLRTKIVRKTSATIPQQRHHSAPEVPESPFVALFWRKT
ncbi:MAG: hypothetical protein R6T87_12070 [Marinobacter sp.]